MILITGGAGYIGSHVNKLLNEAGRKTVVYDDLGRGNLDSLKWGTFCKGSLGETKTLRSVFRDFDIDAVVHLAAYAYVGESCKSPKMYYENNVVNTIKLLAVMEEFGCKKIVFSSTCATYGIPEYLPIDEKHRQSPINPYGQTKLMVEKIMEDYRKAYGLNYISLRYFNAAGADSSAEIGEKHEPESHLIPLVIAAALENQHVKVFGNDYETKDGTAVRDYIHVEDIADAHNRSLDYLDLGNKSDVFNLGNGRGYSVLEIIREVERACGVTLAIDYEERRQGDPPLLIGDGAKAKDLLGWRPKNSSLENIIETALRWHRLTSGVK